MDYGKIINRAVELTKKNKWLWIYGMVLAMTSAASFRGGGGGGGGKSSTSQPLPSVKPENFQNSLSQVGNTFDTWLKSIDPSFWVVLVFGIILLVGLLIIIGLITRNWARASLINGLDLADQGKETNLSNTSPLGIRKVKDLIIYDILASLFGLGIILLTAIVVGSIFALGIYSLEKNPPIQMIFGIIVGITGFTIFIYTVILLALVSIYAERLIVLKNYSPLGAWKKAFGLSKHNFFPTLWMAVINGALGCTAGCLASGAILLVLGAPIGIIIYQFTKNGWQAFSWLSVLVLIILVFCLGTLMMTVRGIITVFSFGTWNLFFKEIWGKENL